MFNEKLCTLNFQEIYAISDLDSKYDLFIKTFKELYDKCFPLQKKLLLKKINVLSLGLLMNLRKGVKKKKRLYKKFLIAPSSQRERVPLKYLGIS